MHNAKTKRLDRCFEFDFNGLFGRGNQLWQLLDSFEKVTAKTAMMDEAGELHELTTLKDLAVFCFKVGQRYADSEKCDSFQKMQPEMYVILKKHLFSFRFIHPVSGSVFEGKNLADFCSFFYDNATGAFEHNKLT